MISSKILQNINIFFNKYKMNIRYYKQIVYHFRFLPTQTPWTNNLQIVLLMQFTVFLLVHQF